MPQIKQLIFLVTLAICCRFAVIVVEADGIVGDTCYFSSDCSARNSYCKLNSASCSHGTCTCYPGFALASDGNCRRKVALGVSCNATTDVCSTPSADCLSGTCTCSQGYTTGLTGSDCISWQKTIRYGGSCTDSVNCYYGLTCINNVCTCSTGQKAIADYDCTPRVLNDTCTTNDDCSLTPNAVCSNGKCGCQGGYTFVSYATTAYYPTKFSYGCVPSIESMRVEGAQCSNAITASGTQICRLPYICVQCDNSGYNFCGRMELPLLGASGLSGSTPMIVSAVMIGLIVSLYQQNK